MRTLLTDLTLTVTPEGGVVASGNRYFKVSEHTILLLRAMMASDGATCIEIATTLSRELGFTVAPEEVEQAISALPRAFFEHADSVAEFRWSITLLQGRPLGVLASLFSVLFFPLPALCFIAASVYALWWTNEHYSASSATSIAAPVLVLLGIFVHEVGHAAACAYSRAKPGVIGIGIKGLFPTFYTDVSDIWSRGRVARMRVDAGGVYFQFLYAGALTALVPWYPQALPAVSLTLMLATFSCLPYFKFDGYWLLGDFLGVDNLSASIKATRLQLWNSFREGLLSAKDILPAVGIAVYYSGIVALFSWITFAFLRLFFAHINHIANMPSEEVSSAFSLISLVVLLGFIAVVIRWLAGSVREFRFLLLDIPLVIRALTLAWLTAIAKPLIHIPRKHRPYVNAVERGMKRASPSIPNAAREARGSVVAKYYELFWYQLLDRITPSTGRLLIRLTHRVRSSRTLADVANIAGPVILAAPHYGSFISGAILLLSEIGSVRQVHLFYADPKTDPNNGRYENFYRRYFPDLSILFNNKRGIIEAARALRRNEVLIIMPDVFHGNDLVTIKLLGQTVGIMPGIAYFHQKFGASVVPVLSRFRRLPMVDVYAGEALEFHSVSGTSEPRHCEIMEQLFAWFATWFRLHPDNWHCWDKFGRNEIAPIADVGPQKPFDATSPRITL